MKVNSNYTSSSDKSGLANCQDFKEFKLAVEEDLLHTLTTTFLNLSNKLMLQYLISTTITETVV
jgi:hypothetical protein